ncbi:MAG: hypothetical protein AAFW95_11595 [Cyanobacteria bacterium J06638_6]
MDPIMLVVLAAVFIVWTRSTLGQTPPETEQPAPSAEQELLIALGKILSKDGEG